MRPYSLRPLPDVLVQLDDLEAGVACPCGLAGVVLMRRLACLLMIQQTPRRVFVMAPAWFLRPEGSQIAEYALPVDAEFGAGEQYRTSGSGVHLSDAAGAQRGAGDRQQDGTGGD